MIPVGMQMYTMREIAKDDYGKALAIVKRIGYPGAQVSGMFNKTAEEMAGLLKKHKLIPAAAHIGLDRMESDLEGVIKECKTIGFKDVAVPSIPPELRADAKAWEKVAKAMNSIGAKLRAKGVQLSYHNHAFEFEPVKGSDKCGFDILFANVDLANLQPEIDTYWVAFGKRDPAELLERFKGHINLVHIKDGLLGGDKPEFAEIGEGDLDWPPIFKACASGGTRWLLVEQDQTKIGPEKSAELSFRNLKKMKQV